MDIINGGIHDFVPWYDTDGNRINASDGGIIQVDGTYHWYGMAMRPLPNRGRGQGGQQTTTGVVMYASEDLHTWRYEGVILPVSDDPSSPLYAPMRFERPKILRCPSTGEFVLWCHYVCYPGDHGDTPGTAEAGLAVCDTVNGTYRWLGMSRPIDDSGLVRDCTVFQDTDGQAYFVYDRQNTPEDRCLHIVRLTEDYHHFTDDWKRIDPAYRREAAAILREGDWYVMVTSGLTSWDFNQARYYRTRNLMGIWEDMGDPCIGDTDAQTFHSQSTYAFRTADGLPILMLERHNVHNFAEDSYIWLPMELDAEGHLTLRYLEQWKLGE